ncbi:DUF6527 family protein [Chryseosolibacter histidini]|uniref:DUF6527 family protein n=1 Tax=Chryseosolibacter histidini TaxID=2782349 RepID=UPI0034DABF40
MNPLRYLIDWCQLYRTKRGAQEYAIVKTDNFPQKVKRNVIYIIQDGDVPDTVIFKCPCGCTSDIYLNLLKDTRPNWNFHLNKKGKITIVPSIWRKVGCQSHFFVRKSKVCWA